MPTSSFDSDAAAQEKEAMHGNVMAWALRNTFLPEHVHIGMVQPHENGLKCKCVCIACGKLVLAINADKGNSHFQVKGTQQKHFKHQIALLNDGSCNREVARRVALRLYVEQGMVELPPVSRQKSATLPNGETVLIQSHGDVETMRVSRRIWINELNVMIIGDDGRECLVTVLSQYSVDEKDKSTCVLSLHNALNESLANLSSEAILALLNDPQRGPRWLRHRDDNKRDALIEEDFKRREAALNGDIPDEWLQGLTGKQKSETILHWLIKRAVSSLGQLKVPRHSVPVVMSMPDGTTETRNAVCPAGTLILQDVRLEKRIGSMVPDIVCKARMGNSNLPVVDLLIEAAVTHYIDDDKLQKIHASGSACLEIQARAFHDAGRVHASRIESIVGLDETAKIWIVHPWMNRYTQAATDFLHRRANLIADELKAKVQAEADRRQSQAAYQQWLQDASDLNLAKGFLKAIRTQWEDLPPRTMGTTVVNVDDLWNVLARRGLVSGAVRSLEAKDGLLCTLHRIDQAIDNDALDPLIDRFSRAVMSRFMDGGVAILIMFALDTKRSIMDPGCLKRYDDQRRLLNADIEQGNEHLSRDTRLNGLLSLLFPEMRKALDSEFSTKKHLEERRASVAKARATLERKRHVRQQRLLLVRQGRVAQKEESRQRDLAQRLSEIHGTLRWTRSIHDYPGIAMLADLYRANFSKMDTLAFFKHVRESIASNESVESSLRRARLTTAEEVSTAVELLIKAKICI